MVRNEFDSMMEARWEMDAYAWEWDDWDFSDRLDRESDMMANRAEEAEDRWCDDCDEAEFDNTVAEAREELFDYYANL